MRFLKPNIHIAKYVLITTPDKFIEQIDAVSEMIGINEKVKTNFINRLEKK